MEKKWLTSLVFLFASMAVQADPVVVDSSWRYSSNAKIVLIMEWQDDNPVYFQLDNNEWCYIPSSEKNTYSLLLSLFMSGKKAHIHCHLSTESNGGQGGHRLHRIIAVAE